MVKFRYICLPLILLGTPLFAQTEKSLSFIQKIGKTFSETDTAYIAPNEYNLTFMIEQSFWSERYKLKTTINNDRQAISFAPTPTPKIGAYFGWRWIFLGVSFNVRDIFKKGHDGSSKQEYVFNLYSSRIGLDLYYRKTGSDFRINSYSGFNVPENHIGQKFEGFQSKIIGLNTYWIFNNKHFSYPAAYSQSTNQKKNCGSFMAGFSYSNHDITFDPGKLPDDITGQLRPSLKFHTLQYHDYNISLGYGYNWVFAKNCLFNISLMPAIAYKKAKFDGQVSDTTDSQWLNWTNDINFDIITRAALVWNNKKYYIGASFVLNTYDYRKSNFSMTNSFGSLRIYAGFNFWKQKQYRHNEE